MGSEILPVDIRPYLVGKAILEAGGVKFLGVADGDDIFQYVELPIGWRWADTDKIYWTVLVDANGVERAEMFYKRVFYDRCAFLNVFTPA